MRDLNHLSARERWGRALFEERTRRGLSLRSMAELAGLGAHLAAGDVHRAELGQAPLDGFLSVLEAQAALTEALEMTFKVQLVDRRVVDEELREQWDREQELFWVRQREYLEQRACAEQELTPEHPARRATDV